MEKNSKTKKSRQDSISSPDKQIEKESHILMLSDDECPKFAVADHEIVPDAWSQRLPEPEPIYAPVKAISNRSLSEDKAFSKIFSTYKICMEEKLENANN